MSALAAQDIIRMLGLKPHPEGGHFRETFRDTAPGADGRAASTAAYYLLARGERSHWHRLDAAEIWHWYAGAPLQLEIAATPGRVGHDAVQAPATCPGDLTMTYQIAPLFCRPWTLLGFTPRLIESHYENNYGGTFTRLNALSAELEALEWELALLWEE